MKKLILFNEKVAIFGTQIFSSMWTCYAFCLWGLLGMIPWLPKPFTNIVLLVSSAWIQLFALPLIAVGAAVLNRASERRAKEDHRMLKAEFASQNQELVRLSKIDVKLDEIQMKELGEIKAMLAQILTKLGADESAPNRPPSN
jgi:hypothetical protein